MDLINIKPNVISENLNDKIFLFYGEQGTRKTTVAGNFEDSIIAGFEIGYKFISGAIAQPIQSWTEFRTFLRQLKKPEVKERYKTVVIDTVTIAYSMCNDYVLAPLGASDPGDLGYGKGWRAVRKEFERTIMSIPQMGYGLVLIAHADEMQEESTGSVRAKVDIDKRPAAIIKGLADFIFYTRKEYRENSAGLPEDLTVYAYSGLVDIESKSRSRYFIKKFEFTYENLKTEMEKAIEMQKKIEGVPSVDEKENPYEIQEEDFDQLKQDVIDLAAALLETSASEQVSQVIIQHLPEKIERISDFSPIYRQRLEILQQELLDIQDRLN